MHSQYVLPISVLIRAIADLDLLTTVESALRAGANASPPFNMHRALIYQGALVCSTVFWIFFVKGEQVRRELDERMLEESKRGISMDSNASTPPLA